MKQEAAFAMERVFEENDGVPDEVSLVIANDFVFWKSHVNEVYAETETGAAADEIEENENEIEKVGSHPVSATMTVCVRLAVTASAQYALVQPQRAPVVRVSGPGQDGAFDSSFLASVLMQAVTSVISPGSRPRPTASYAGTFRATKHWRPVNCVSVARYHGARLGHKGKQWSLEFASQRLQLVDEQR